MKAADYEGSACQVSKADGKTDPSKVREGGGGEELNPFHKTHLSARFRMELGTTCLSVRLHAHFSHLRPFKHHVWFFFPPMQIICTTKTFSELLIGHEYFYSECECHAARSDIFIFCKQEHQPITMVVTTSDRLQDVAPGK